LFKKKGKKEVERVKGPAEKKKDHRKAGKEQGCKKRGGTEKRMPRHPCP